MNKVNNEIEWIPDKDVSVSDDFYEKLMNRIEQEDLESYATQNAKPSMGLLAMLGAFVLLNCGLAFYFLNDPNSQDTAQESVEKGQLFGEAHVYSY